MRAVGLFLMNEGSKRKCIPVSALRGSSCLFGEFVSDVGVLHPCSTQENKTRGGRRKTRTRKNINKKKWGPGGGCAENCCGHAATPPEVAPPVNCRPGTKEELKLM